VEKTREPTGSVARLVSAVRSGWSPLRRLLSPEVRNAFLVFLAALVAALLRASPAVVIAMAMFGVLLSAWAVRRRGAEAAGPMFFYDLVRLARRGRSTSLRCLYALLLLAGLYFVYWNRFPVEAEFANLFRLRPKVRLDELAHFAGTFATSLFALQSAAVLILTPAYVSGAIAEEKERRTLELLFTTHLTDREIVLGKLFGRSIHLLGVILAGLPILMVLQVWGGVEPLLPLAGFFVTVLTLLSVGGICIYCSVACRDSFTALIVSYVLVVPVAVVGVFVPGCFVSSPVAFMMSLEMHLGAGQFYQVFWPPTLDITPTPATGGTLPVVAMIMVYAVPHLLVAFFCIWGAVRGLRGADATPLLERWLGDSDPETERSKQRLAGLMERRQGESGLKEEKATQRGGGHSKPSPSAAHRQRDRVTVSPDEEQIQTASPESDRPRHPVTDAPLLWKEVYHQAAAWTMHGFWRTYLSSVAVLLLLTYLVLFLAALGEYDQLRGGSFVAAARHSAAAVVNPAVRVLGILLTGAWCIASAWRTASSITREREGRTLGALLTLPGDRSEIVWTKWWGGVLRFRWLGIALLATWTAGLASGALHPLAALLLAAAVTAHLALLAGIGVNLSIFSRNTFWANFTMTFVLLAVFVGGWVATFYYELFVGSVYDVVSSAWWEQFYSVGLNPVRTWWYLGFNWAEFREETVGPEAGWQGTLGATLAGMGVYAVLAGLLWIEARRQFQKLDAA
jgi:ABC-type transport system involved in multi-copper enzyme maturation permease subunit